MSSPEQDRRDTARLKLRVPVEIRTQDSDSPIRGATSDLSLSGCYIESIFPFPRGTQLELKLQIDGTLLIMATVVTCDPQVGNGLRFVRMLPEDFEELQTFLKAEAERQRENASGAPASEAGS